MAHDVFISHSSIDKAVADAVCASLEANGVRCWIAPRDVTPGENWAASIVRGIDGSRMMVLVFSGHANESSQIFREVGLAADKKLPIVPIRIADVMPQSDLRYYLSTTHWMDALTPPLEAHLREFVEKVRTLLEIGGDRPKVVIPSAQPPHLPSPPPPSTPPAPAAHPPSPPPWLQPQGNAWEPPVSHGTRNAVPPIEPRVAPPPRSPSSAPGVNWMGVTPQAALILSIILAVCFCPPVSIVGIVFSIQAKTAEGMGHIQQAQDKLRLAVIMAGVSLIGGIATFIIYGIYVAAQSQPLN